MFLVFDLSIGEGRSELYQEKLQSPVALLLEQPTTTRARLGSNVLGNHLVVSSTGRESPKPRPRSASSKRCPHTS